MVPETRCNNADPIELRTLKEGVCLSLELGTARDHPVMFICIKCISYCTPLLLEFSKVPSSSFIAMVGGCISAHFYPHLVTWDWREQKLDYFIF